MAPVAIVARPRLWLAGALLAVTLFGRHDAERAPVVAPAPPRVVIQLRPSSDLATLAPATRDDMNSGVGPLASWISHLLLKLTGDAC